MSWLSLAQNLPLGRTSRCDCPECGEGTNTNAAIINHSTRGYSLFCHACGYNPFENKGEQTLAELKRIQDLNDAAERFTDENVRLPPDFSKTIPLVGRLWLYSGGITPSVWEEYGIGYSDTLHRVIIPVYGDTGLVWYQGRAVHDGQRPKYLNPTCAKDGRLFFSHNVDLINESTIIICEDILSAIRVGRATRRNLGDKFVGASLLGTKLCTSSIVQLGEFARVIGWFDNDNAGREAARTLYKSVSVLTDVTILRSEKDPKRYSDDDINLMLKGVL